MLEAILSNFLETQKGGMESEKNGKKQELNIVKSGLKHAPN